jgi:Sulfotransferase family
MLRGSFNKHSDVWVTRETHFFDDIRPRLPIGEPLRGESAQRCEEYLLRVGHRAYGLESDPNLSRIARDDLRARASELGSTSDSYFEAFCRLMAEANKAERWGEKTPRHVFRIDDLLDVFPQGKVICLVRDPRAVVASYRDWTTGKGDQGGRSADRDRAARSYNLVLHSLLWRSTMRAAEQARRDHGSDRVRLAHYEELVAEPEGALRRLVEWLELDFEEAMLDVPVLRSSYDMDAEGITTEPVDRWRRKLAPHEVALIEQTGGRLLTDLGYARTAAKIPVARLVWAWVTLPVALLRATLANRNRLGKAMVYVRRRAVLALRRGGSSCA